MMPAGKLTPRHNKPYIRDEPTADLHLADMKSLILQLSRLVDAGNAVVVVEENMCGDSRRMAD